MGRSYINRLISQNKKWTHFAITLKDIKFKEYIECEK